MATETTWIAEAYVNGKWVEIARSFSKFVSSLALTRYEIASIPTRLTETR